MKFRHLFFPLLLLLAIASVPGCSDNPPESQATQEAPPAAPEPAPAPAENVAGQAPPETAATPEAAPAAPTERVAPKKNSVPTITDNPEGKSTGYISRENVSLQKEPLEKAAKTRSFKRYEGVIILETKMTDENGKVSDLPVWYKVECVDKKTGWVEARSVTVN